MRNIYTSVDIGTDSIKIVVCEVSNNKLNLLAASSVKSKGITKGVITDFSEAALSLREAVSEIENMLGVIIKEAITSVPSYGANFRPVKGLISIDKNKPVSGVEINEVIASAANRYPDSKMEIVTVIPITFGLDGKAGIKDPKGLFGDELEVHAIMVSVPKKSVVDTVTLFSEVGIELTDISINGIGSYYAFRNKDYDSTSGAIIDMGKDTTTITIVNKGIVVNNSVIELGSRMIEKDLAYVFKTSVKNALVMKEKFALAHKLNASNTEIFDIEDENMEQPIIVNQFEASEVAMSRIEEILSVAKKDIAAITNGKVKFVIITGGASNMRDFKNIAVEIFGDYAIIGNVKLIGIRDNRFAPAVGNIVYFVSKLKLKGENYSMFSSSDIETFSINRQEKEKNDTMLNKVFGYFWNNEEDK